MYFNKEGVENTGSVVKIVIEAAKDILDTRIKEILCKPR